ncbi:MAG: hypothetical protein GF307_15030, partial [candidate division Zixibacteria bacterium]|nr:hypothetical protein [candidate division Zixibacteria bacterium]
MKAVRLIGALILMAVLVLTKSLLGQSNYPSLPGWCPDCKSVHIDEDYLPD